MKNNQLIAALTGIFGICALVTFYNVWQYRSSLKTFEATEARVEYISVVRPMLENLLADTTDYSKRNPAVIPILQSLTNNMTKIAAASVKPATK